MEGVPVSISEAVDDTEETGALQKRMQEECIAEIKGDLLDASLVQGLRFDEVLRGVPIGAGLRIEGKKASFLIPVYAFVPIDHKSQVLVFVVCFLAFPQRDSSGCIFVAWAGINYVHILKYLLCLYF